jgi:hypothetical protein
MCPVKSGLPLVPCIHLQNNNNEGFCNYPGDLDPLVPGNCVSPCIPASACTLQPENDTACSDSDSETLATGGCFNGEEDSDVFCITSCRLKMCDNTHICIPLESSEGVIDGTGSCMQLN